MKRAEWKAQRRNLKFKLGFQDEARFGRITMPNRCWAPKGMRPISPQQIIREYTYAYGVVFPNDGDFDGLILPTMDTPAMNIFLKEISERHPQNYILMVVDGAACHRGGELEIPNNIELLQLPPYSPQLNPVENLWDEMREKWFGNIVFNSMEAVEHRLVTALLDFESNQKLMKNITGWDWIIKSIE